MTIALLVAAATTRADSLPPASLAARVRVEVAQRWHVDSSRVQLQWGQVPPLGPADANAPIRLMGTGSDGWYVVIVEPPTAPPHAIRVRAGELRPVRVARVALRAGQPLAATDIAEQELIVWSPPSPAPAALPSLEGWELRRDTPAGTVLSAGVVLAPRAIAMGDKVVFSWAQNGVRIEREAVALGSARVGDPVQGRAGTTRLTGRATGPGVAQLTEVVQ